MASPPADSSPGAGGLEAAPSERKPRRQNRRRRSWVSRALSDRGEALTAGLVVAAVVGSAQAIGAVHVPVLLVVAVLGLLSCVIAYRARLTTRWRVATPALVLLALAAYTLLQAVPLPAGLVARLAPGNYEVWSGALGPFREAAPRFMSLSLDPGASVVEGLKWLLYAATFASAAAVGTRRGAHWGATVVFASGVAVAISSLGHRLVGATTVYGLYAPIGEFHSEKIGPLLNPNNLSGYLNLGIFSGFGLLLMRRPPAARWLLGLGAALQVGALIEAGSRGGLLALALGLPVLTLALSFARKSLDPSLADRMTVRWVLGGVLAGGALLALLALTQQGATLLGDRNVEKIKLLSWVRPMLAEHPWFGIGRGAFESVFPHYRIGPDNVIYSHPENFVAQWLSEWGIPAGLLALAGLAWSLRPKMLGVGREAVAIGAFTALFVLLVQNLVDLGLEVPAIPLAIATTLGSCWGSVRSAEERGRERASADGFSVVAAWGLLGVSLLLVTGSAYFGWRTVGDDRLRLSHELAEADLKSPEARASLRAKLRSAMLRHPAEPYFARVGAVAAWRGGDQSPLPWIDRALERGLTSGRTHYLLARLLASAKDRSQALLEIRFAIEYDPSLVKRGAELAASLSSDPEELLRVVPMGRPAPAIEALTRELGKPELALAREQFLRRATARFPSVAGPRVALATGLLAGLNGKGGSVRCAGERRAECISEVERESAAVAKLSPDTFESLELQAQLLLATGRAAEVEKLLAGKCERFKGRRCNNLRLTAATQTRSEAHVTEATRAVLAEGCETPQACAASYESLGDTMMSAGNWNQARQYYRRATQEDGSAERWLKLANAASKASAHMEAADALEHVIRERGPDAKLQERIDRERRGAMLNRFGKDK